MRYDRTRFAASHFQLPIQSKISWSLDPKKAKEELNFEPTCVDPVEMCQYTIQRLSRPTFHDMQVFFFNFIYVSSFCACIDRQRFLDLEAKESKRIPPNSSCTGAGGRRRARGRQAMKMNIRPNRIISIMGLHNFQKPHPSTSTFVAVYQ
jgi:hypothetical protein